MFNKVYILKKLKSKNLYLIKKKRFNKENYYFTEKNLFTFIKQSRKESLLGRKKI